MAVSRAAPALLRVGRNTADLDRALAFYRDALGFRVEAASESRCAWTGPTGEEISPARRASVVLGAQQIELTEFVGAAPYPSGSASCDLWFQHCAIAVSDLDAAYRRVIQHGATPITRGGPQSLPPSTGSVSAFKFRDPDGHPLELIHFPAGTGDPMWQQPRGDAACPTLGVDHSAISVGDVEHSIAFYARLGFNVAARGVNRGAAQQRLDNLESVVVDVVALQPTRARTPHVELLGYRTPRGQAAPATDIRDIVADRMVLRMRNLHATLASLSSANVEPAAHGAGSSTEDPRHILLRDPDGHWLELV